MKNVKLTPHEALSVASDHTDQAAQALTSPAGNSAHVPDLNILSAWNDRRQRLLKPVLHLL